jgi:hypothetical protein
LPWDKLLKFHRKNQQEWPQRTLPLLARPEIGFPSEVQNHLLGSLAFSPRLKQELRRQRRRLVTDAVIALSIQKYNKIPKFPSDQYVEELIATIDQVYLEAHPINWWAEKIENSQASRKKPSRIKRIG